MDNYNTSQQTKKINPLLAAFLIAQLIIAILIVTFLFNNSGDGPISEDNSSNLPQSQISNFTDYFPELDEKSVSHIQRYIFDAISDNYTNVNISEKLELIEDSIIKKYFEKADVNYLSALVNDPQSDSRYKIYYIYTGLGTDAPNDQILVVYYSPEELQKLYSTEEYGRFVAQIIGQLEFDSFFAFIDNNHLNTINIAPSDLSVDAPPEVTYIDEVSRAIESLGFSPDSFEYKVIRQSDIDR